MIELYVFVILSSIGYIISKKPQTPSIQNNNDYSKSSSLYEKSKPTMYDNNQHRSAQIHKKQVESKYNCSSVIENVTKNDQSNSQMYSRLSGEHIEHFEHNNMKPFFGGTVKQNLDVNTNATTLENHTGVSNTRIDKNENICFTDQHVNNNRNINGPSMYEIQTDRLKNSISKKNNNFQTHEQVQVGPGVNPGNKFENLPSGGFQQKEYRDILEKSYKTIDELRVLSNPQTTYSPPVLQGKKHTKRSDTPNLAKNKVDRFYEKSEKHLFKTTGSVTKNTHRSCNILSDNNRTTTSNKSYTGNAFDNSGVNQTTSSAHTKRNKNSLKNYGVRNASTHNLGNSKDDYGRENIQVYSNERDVTHTRTHQGNFSSFVKSFIMPIQHSISPTMKEYTIAHPRPSGNFNGPNKQTIYDPTDTAKTTLKETLIHDENTGHIKVYNKQTIYDPTDVARTTIKETMINDTITGNINLLPKSIVYDPQDVSRITTKEILPNYNNDVNIRGAVKQTIYDPTDTAKTTVKETTIDSHRDGNINSLQQGNAYENTKMNPKITNKQFTSDFKYSGNPQKEQSDGYKNASVKVPVTNKQFTSDNHHIGSADTTTTANKSYENIYNAVMNEHKESILQSRKPSDTSTKINAGKDFINLTNIKDYVDNSFQSTYITNIHDKMLDKNSINVTKKPVSCNLDRLDPAIVESFKSNPYTQSLSSAV